SGGECKAWAADKFLSVSLSSNPSLVFTEISRSFDICLPHKSAAHLGCEARYESLRELTQDDPILE
ncbi:hypothetical protein GOODEAATRI_019274, partial [Goodea atripinnis]